MIHQLVSASQGLLRVIKWVNFPSKATANKGIYALRPALAASPKAEKMENKTSKGNLQKYYNVKPAHVPVMTRRTVSIRKIWKKAQVRPLINQGRYWRRDVIVLSRFHIMINNTE